MLEFARKESRFRDDCNTLHPSSQFRYDYVGRVKMYTKCLREVKRSASHVNTWIIAILTIYIVFIFCWAPEGTQNDESSKHVANTIYITRHGARHDWVFRNWSATAKRPHDPPLSELGERQGTHCIWLLAVSCRRCTNSCISR